MRRCILAITIALIAVTLAAGVPASAAPPSPSVQVSCTVGGNTLVSWTHLHVTQILANWSDSTGTVVDMGTFGTHRSPFTFPTPPRVDVGGTVVVTLIVGSIGARRPPTPCT